MGLMGVIFGSIYWILESFLDAYVYGLGSLWGRLLSPDLNELMMRLLAVALIGAFGLYAQGMFDRLRRIEQRLARLNELFLSFGPDPVANIDRLTALCGEMLGADAARYSRLDQGALCSWGQWHWPCDRSHGEALEGRICFDSVLQDSHEALLIRNLASSSYAETDPDLIRQGFRTYYGQAVQLGVKNVGTLCTFFRNDFIPSHEDQRVMGILTSAIGVEEVRRQAEIALRSSENRMKELSAQLLKAQETERKRIAQQMHDSIGQSLGAIKFSIEETLETLRDAVPPNRLRPLEAAVPLIRETVSEVRRIQRNLRPAMLDDLGILATLAWFCREFQAVYSKIAVELKIEIKEQDVAEPLKIVMFRLVQEAFNNVAKHSHASRLCLSLQRSPHHALRLSIEDNGRGFHVEQHFGTPGRSGLGLSSMRERTTLSGGALTIASEPESGTRITAVWPLNG